MAKIAGKDNGLTPVNMRGHSTQDDFEYRELFDLIVLGDHQVERFLNNNHISQKQKDEGDLVLIIPNPNE